MNFPPKSAWIAAVAAGLILAGCGGTSGRRPEQPQARESSTEQTEAKVQRSLGTAATVSEQTGDYSSAIGYYRKLYEKDQNNPEFIIGLSRNLRYSDQGAQARLFMDLVINQGVDGPSIRAEYGKAQLADGLPDKGVENLARAIQMGDDGWPTYSALGTAYDRLENYAEAQKAYQRAIALSPENPIILNNLALSLAVSGELNRAIEILERAAVRPGTNPTLRQNLAMLHSLNGDKKAARAMGRMDLSEKDVAKNLEYYQQFLNGNPASRR